jgi:hypothetical protein
MLNADTNFGYAGFFTGNFFALQEKSRIGSSETEGMLENYVFMKTKNRDRKGGCEVEVMEEKKKKRPALFFAVVS